MRRLPVLSVANAWTKLEIAKPSPVTTARRVIWLKVELGAARVAVRVDVFPALARSAEAIPRLATSPTLQRCRLSLGRMGSGHTSPRSKVRSIGINGTVCSRQRASSFRRWRDATPDDFVFAVKGPRFITPIMRLSDVRIPLANFFASGVLALGKKLGPLLWQLPPSFSFDARKLSEFFALLPRDTVAAAQRARAHDQHVAEPVTHVREDYRLKHALEVRHVSLVSEAFATLLGEHDVGLVAADTAGKWPPPEDVTSDLVYVRLHGDAQIHTSGYTAAALPQCADSSPPIIRGPGGDRWRFVSVL